jgi:hypothetical protein
MIETADTPQGRKPRQRSGRRQFGSVRRLPSKRWQASYWHLGMRHLAGGREADYAFIAHVARTTAVETSRRRCCRATKNTL